MTSPTGRYSQCDATCTTDCGHFKGQGPPTTPTGPDDDRLRAAIARLEGHGQETAGQWILDEGARAREFLRGFPEGALPVVTYPPGHRPAPQQPPAQEQKAGHEFTEDVDDYSMCLCGIPALGHDEVLRDRRNRFAPPSEADSAGEVCGAVSHWRGVTCQNPPHTHDRHNADDGRSLYTWTTASVAASSVVRGGDDQARERLADVLASNVAFSWGLAVGIDRAKWPEFWAEVADIAVTTLRAAGWQP